MFYRGEPFIKNVSFVEALIKFIYISKIGEQSLKILVEVVEKKCVQTKWKQPLLAFIPSSLISIV